MSQRHARSDLDAAASAGAEIERGLEAIRVEAQRRRPADILLLRTAAPSVAPEALLEGFLDREAVLWHPPTGSSFAGIGVAHSITGSGRERFAQVRRAQSALWERAGVTASSATDWDAPRLFGGFAFAPDGATTEHWSSFGPARFVLPRITYAVEGSKASLTLAIERRELEQGSGEAEELFRRAHDILAGAARPTSGLAVQPASRRDGDPKSFELQVDQLVERIQRGELLKAVAARQVLLSFANPVDPVATVVALSEQAPECVRFLFRSGDAAFLGATPERLVHKRDRILETEALAGSIDAGTDGAERQLEASAKDLEEHALVVSAIIRALTPLCDSPKLPVKPGVRRLKHLLHLCTPIHARLTRDTHVLELVERLHPTPAVGGVPTPAALECIAQTESFDRGWYAGAIGWCDAFGNGDFNVALRSGLVWSDKAQLYAGAGIVRESQAALEYAETTLKLSAMLSSLRTRR